MNRSKRRSALFVLLSIVMLMAAACSQEDDGGGGNGGGGGGGGGDASADTNVSGEVRISGSSTVEPISALVREAYLEQNDGVEISVDGPGTGDGFQLFCEGDISIADASRPIQDEEVAACEENGVEWIELEIGIDGLAVITSPDNDIECLNFADLYALAGPESQGVETWADAQPLADELGSTTELPDSNLVITAPGEESGTYDSFIEIAFGDIAEARVEEGQLEEDQAESARPDYSASPDDNAIIEGVSSDAGGLGWVGFAFADQAENVRMVPIASEPDGECVEPSAETVQDGSYPLSRSLYIYVSANDAEENEAVADFVDFYLADLATFVEESDYVPLEDEAPVLQRWEDRTTGPAEEEGSEGETTTTAAEGETTTTAAEGGSTETTVAEGGTETTAAPAEGEDGS